MGEQCPTCGGDGEIVENSPFMPIIDLCPTCRGDGVIDEIDARMVAAALNAKPAPLPTENDRCPLCPYCGGPVDSDGLALSGRGDPEATP